MGNPLSNIGKYIKALGSPMEKAIGGLTDLDVIRRVYDDVDDKASDIVKKFGQGRENILSVKQNMAEAYQDVAKMGGSFSDINNIQGEIAGKLNRSVIVNRDAYKELYAMYAVTNQNIGVTIEGFKNAGYSIYQAGKQMQGVVDTAREIGASVEDVSSKVIANMEQLNRFNFQGGVEGLAKMAAQASTLRINMQSTLSFAEKVYNPEGAIETAAALQRLGVTQAQLLDPLRLMNLAQNDPTELQNQIVEMTRSFVQLGEAGNFEIMPGAKSRLYEISKAMQIPYDQITKMALGSFELEDKMKKIKFPDVDQFASKETRQLIANMAEKGKDGEYRIKFTDTEGKTQEKNITQLTEKDIETLKTPPKKMEELAVDQLSVLKRISASLSALSGSTAYGIAGAKSMEDIMGATVKLYDKMSDTFVKTFDSKEIRESMDKGLQGMFNSILNDKTLEGFKTAGTEVFNFFTNLTNKFSQTAGKNWDEFIKDENKFVQVMVKLGGQLKDLSDNSLDSLIKKINEVTGTKPGGGTGGTSGGTGGLGGGGTGGLGGGGGGLGKYSGSEYIERGNNKSGIDTIPAMLNEGERVVTTDNNARYWDVLTAVHNNRIPPNILNSFARTYQEGNVKSNMSAPQNNNYQDLMNRLLNQTDMFNQSTSSKPQDINSNINLNLTVNANINGSGINKTEVETIIKDSKMIKDIIQEIQKTFGPNGVMDNISAGVERANQKIQKKR